MTTLLHHLIPTDAVGVNLMARSTEQHIRIGDDGIKSNRPFGARLITAVDGVDTYDPEGRNLLSSVRVGDDEHMVRMDALEDFTTHRQEKVVQEAKKRAPKRLLPPKDNSLLGRLLKRL